MHCITDHFGSQCTHLLHSNTHTLTPFLHSTVMHCFAIRSLGVVRVVLVPTARSNVLHFFDYATQLSQNVPFYYILMQIIVQYMSKFIVQWQLSRNRRQSSDVSLTNRHFCWIPHCEKYCAIKRTLSNYTITIIASILNSNLVDFESLYFLLDLSFKSVQLFQNLYMNTHACTSSSYCIMPWQGCLTYDILPAELLCVWIILSSIRERVFYSISHCPVILQIAFSLI